MIPRKLKVAFAFFSYGGNGGIKSEVPEIRSWYAKTLLKASKDERIESCDEIEIAETPIPMARNRSVLISRSIKSDVLVMVDSDNAPDNLLDLPGAKPFFESSFDFIYKNYDKGPHVVGAPYCGPPPHELVYVFRWERKSNLAALANDLHIGKYSRHEAAMLSGILPVGGLPTGLIMYDMRIFDVTEPAPLKEGETAKGWFYYEWVNRYAAEKASTEDGTATRDMAQIGYQKLGYNPVHCNWDAWAGHWKPYCVSKPHPVSVDSTTKVFAQAVKDGMHGDEQLQVRGDQSRGVSDFFMDEANKSMRFSDTVTSAFPKEVLDAFERPVEELIVDGNSTSVDREVLGELAGKFRHGKIVEVGTFMGQTAKLLANASEGVVACVDHFCGGNDLTATFEPAKLRAAFMENCKKHIACGQIVLVEASSQEAAEQFEDDSFHMAYIDANHTYEMVKRDIELWLPKVVNGGIIAGHDYGILVNVELDKEAFPGVRQAVDEVFPNGSLNKPRQGSSVWWVQL